MGQVPPDVRNPVKTESKAKACGGADQAQPVGQLAKPQVKVSGSTGYRQQGDQGYDLDH